MHPSYTALVIFFPFLDFAFFLGMVSGLCLANTDCGSPALQSTIWVFVFPFIPPAFSEWAVGDAFVLGTQLLVWQCWVMNIWMCELKLK